jgi:hypothetical protein
MTITKIRPNFDEQHNYPTKTRSVSRIINSIKTTEGEGFIVHRSLPGNSLLDFDPFLLLDEMGPMDLKPGEAKGAPIILTEDSRLLHMFWMENSSIRTHTAI